MQVEKGLYLSRTSHPQPSSGRWQGAKEASILAAVTATHLSPLVPVGVHRSARHLHVRDGVPSTSSCGPVALLCAARRPVTIITRRRASYGCACTADEGMGSHQCITLIGVAGLGNEDRIAQQGEGDRAQQMSRLLDLLRHGLLRTRTERGAAEAICAFCAVAFASASSASISCGCYAGMVHEPSLALFHTGSEGSHR